VWCLALSLHRVHGKLHCYQNGFCLACNISCTACCMWNVLQLLLLLTPGLRLPCPLWLQVL